MAAVKSVEKKARNVAERAFNRVSKVVTDSINKKKPMDWIHHVVEKMQESFTKLESCNEVFLNSIDLDLDENKDEVDYMAASEKELNDVLFKFSKYKGLLKEEKKAI